MRCSRADKKGRGNAAASTTGPDGNPGGASPLSYTMQIPNSGTSASASPVGAAHLYAQREKPAANFINTGHDPIILYNYFYDAQCGQVGFQPNRGLVERSGAWRPKEFADARQESDERASLVHHAAFAVPRYGLDKREPWPKRSSPICGAVGGFLCGGRAIQARL